MRRRLMTSAIALAGVLAFAGVAQAQDPVNSQNSNSTVSFDDWEPEDSYNTDNSVEHEDSYNTDNSTEVEDSYNSDSSTEVEDSYNSDSSTEVEDSYNTDNSVEIEDSMNTDVEDSYNDNSDNSNEWEDSLNTDIEHSYNDNSDNSNEWEDSLNTEDSYNTDNSVEVEDSYNDNSDNSQTNMWMSMNYQELNASVSDIDFNMNENDRGAQNGRIRTGAIRQDGGSFAGFSGVQTVTNNTGLASVGQAATGISANANISFGGN